MVLVMNTDNTITTATVPHQINIQNQKYYLFATTSHIPGHFIGMKMCHDHKQDTVVDDLFKTSEGVHIVSRAFYNQSNARSRPVNSSQQTNIIDLFDPNLEFSQEQVFEEYIDDFLSEQDSPLSQNNDDDSDSISTNDDNIDTILIDQVDSELHSFTPISVKSAMLEFLQLIRQSQINKKQSEHFLSFIKSILPCPNQMPKNMNSLLKRLDVTDYFKKRTICILCEKELEKKQNLYIHGLLANIVSRLALDIEEYKKLIFNPNQETKFDIPFAKVYQRLIQQHSTENLLTLLLHVDGIGLVKSSKLKLWICDASIIELPPELRYRRANVFLISVYIGYTEPNVNIWLKSSFHTLIELKKTG
ncbi:unnamed protein product [Rotaria socialis]|uniref:Uncharacterized protein n=2 Tax=Rotaria socialis TaxID=392032 RepID=A0A817RD86_9BILA|nr:unnamed protein product [Rotaria socialis]